MVSHAKANTWLPSELCVRLAFQVYLHVVIAMCYYDLQTVKTNILHIHHIFLGTVALYGRKQVRVVVVPT
jgi:hypothetical protein